MIQINKQPGQRVLELGGGDARNSAADCMVDVRQTAQTDFTCDLSNPPWPLMNNEWDCVLAHFLLEHISFAKLPAVLREVVRILKPGGRFIACTPNHDAQIKWLKDHPEGWDGKDAFTATSELLYGSQDMELDANVHRCFLTPEIVVKLCRDAGFVDVTVSPYGERSTDMAVVARKSADAGTTSGPYPTDMAEAATAPPLTTGDIHAVAAACEESTQKTLAETDPAKLMQTTEGRQLVFGKEYFNGGGKFGGYAREGMRDFPIHQVTFEHVMRRRPQSVLEIGAGRGYIGKRLEDVGVRYCGLEISRHCVMTRVSDNVQQCDICEMPWPITGSEGSPSGESGHTIDHYALFDLAFSIATLEHIPEQFLPAVIKEMARTCKRGLHGVDFGFGDDGFDKSHVSLHDKGWWDKMFAEHAPGWPVEIVDKEELEQGALAPECLRGDGRLKLNVGCYLTQFHGWTNIDVHDLAKYAAQNGYAYLRHDVRQGLPFQTGTVDLIFAHHFIEHLSYADGIAFLRECRRVLKPGTGALRLVCPDAELLCGLYHNQNCDPTNPETERYAGGLSQFAEISDGVANAPTDAVRLWELLLAGHQAAYDDETLIHALKDAGFAGARAAFRSTGSYPGLVQIQRETIEMPLGGLSLFCDGLPLVG